ncbi:NAD-glutamate dehydrogenase domain-containing protein [Geobacter grbiciae]|uniref:NAD-glutamate dehydrogenase domain-containing protein n=1 Tax=Geobacter grbiciae TaxID=155042 RepID=UPI001C015C97|nr:NAD-glutamate dehydrogenase domain-containing protein [Geobacter grbiciae]MBT1077167.1 NAD-glutamate dehydrogenase [Geobacter grbiciae]
MNYLTEDDIYKKVQQSIGELGDHAGKNLAWLREQMGPYFSITMQQEVGAIATLAAGLESLGNNQRLLLADREKTLILARLNLPGSLYDTLRTLQEREISYAQFTHSDGNLPGLEHELEVHRFDFDRKEHREIAQAGAVVIPEEIRKGVEAALSDHYPRFDYADLDRLLRLLWLNNEQYVRLSPPKRVAQILWLYQQGNRQGGIYLDVEEAERQETQVMFAVGNPPQKDFLVQTMEVFNRLNLGVRRAYCLTISNGVHPYFLGTFYVRKRDKGTLQKGSELFTRLQKELYNTQILSTASQTYRQFVTTGVMTGEEGSLVNAFISFCHTNLAHHHPDPFGYEDVIRAFHSHPDIALQLTTLFRIRFEPGIDGREELYHTALAETIRFVKEYNTGHRYIDDIRRAIFTCAITFIRHTLKTNFFVPEKHALAFRLDPAYLSDLAPEHIADLPQELPFRITFFFGRYGAGYHIGFSDIARGGWRTIITRNRDDYVTCASTMLREVYVLAHTQHLKNKDIYEGGSKMVVVLDAANLDDKELINQRLYKLQFGLINAFLDIFVTDGGKAKDPRVVDYYGEDEPIELGPDENMHDAMIEMIARQSLRRGYLLGIGIMSSKQVGINHKDYGVTSTGVVKFAEITMQELGINIRKDPFSVKFTGGPNGDVAGNAMRIMLERCPQVRIKLILDGTGAIFDPEGMRREELQRILLKDDLDAFDPAMLHPGGFILYRRKQRTEGLRELFKRAAFTESGPVEQWVTLDEFHREFGNLLFSVPTDLFIPAGGRPETIDKENWPRFFQEDGKPTTQAIVEGANSFITPEARLQMQRRGIVVMRDASANKCGVISSSYEIIANLLLTEEEFLANKERYVADVIEILEKRAEDEARLIFRRYKEPGCSQLYTEISNALSQDINAHYARLFNFFQRRSELCADPLFRQAILSHLPRILREEPRYSKRIDTLPAKYKYAILAAEIASSLVYVGDREADFEDMLKGHLVKRFT